MFSTLRRRLFDRDRKKKDAVVVVEWKCGFTWPATLKIRIDRRLVGSVPPDDTAAVPTSAGRHYLSVYSYFLLYPLRRLGGCDIDIEPGTYQQFRVTIHPVVRSEEKWLYLLHCLVFQLLPHAKARSVRYLDILQTDEGRLPDGVLNETD